MMSEVAVVKAPSTSASPTLTGKRRRRKRGKKKSGVAKAPVVLKSKKTKTDSKPKAHQKTIFCKWYQTGECIRGAHCFFRHEYDSSLCSMSFTSWKKMRAGLDRVKDEKHMRQVEDEKERLKGMALKTDSHSTKPVTKSVASAWSSSSKPMAATLRKKMPSPRMPPSTFYSSGMASMYPCATGSYPYSSGVPPHYTHQMADGSFVSDAFDSTAHSHPSYSLASTHSAPHTGYYSHTHSHPHSHDTTNPYAATHSHDTVNPYATHFHSHHSANPYATQPPPSQQLTTAAPNYGFEHAAAAEEFEEDDSDLYFEDEDGQVISVKKEEVYSDEQMAAFERDRLHRRLAREKQLADERVAFGRATVSVGEVYGLSSATAIGGLSADLDPTALGGDSRRPSAMSSLHIPTPTESMSASPPTALESPRICSYFLNGTCFYGGACRNLHRFVADTCPNCFLQIGFDISKQRLHLRIGSDDCCPELYTMAKEREMAVGIECGICLQRISTKRDSRVGLLTGCEHVFCLECIKNWRSTVSESLTKDTIRGCPLCRQISYIVIPSDRVPLNAERKERILESYKEMLSLIECRFWSRRDSSEALTKDCPFGTSCYYRHTNEDGSLQDRHQMPKGLLLTKVGDGSGKVRVLKDVLLSDLIFAQQ